jgi:uncharacterized membrane protein
VGTKIIALLVGGLIGAMLWHGIGFLVGGLAGLLLLQWLAPESKSALEDLTRRIASLERTQGELAVRLAALEGRGDAPEIVSSSAATPAAVPMPAAQSEPPAAAAEAPRAAFAETAPSAIAPSAPVTATLRTERTREVDLPEPGALWKWLTGGNAMVRVGIVVLFFGVAFLVRYATEHVHVPIELRLTGVAVGAIAMLALGWRLRERPGGYGLVLQGGGVGVLYLVVFGALRLWQLLPPELAFALLLAIAFASAAIAIAQDSRALAIAGVTGGFLAPLLASTGEGNHVALFGFYLVLDLGVLAVARYKAWRSLNIVGFAFTFVVGALWGAAYYRPEHYATTQPFLAAFFLLYVAIAVLYAQRAAPRLRDYVDSVLVFGTPLAAAGLQLGLVSEIEYGAAWSAAALGAFYVALAHQLWRQQRESLQLLVECFVALGVAFATLAVPFAFDGRVTAAAWALEGAAAFWVGVRQDRTLPRVFGLLLQPAAGIAFLGAAPAGVAAIPLLNSRCVGGTMVALAGLFCAWYLDRARGEPKRGDRALASLLLAWGTLWWLGTGWHEISQYVAQKSVVRGVQLLFAAASAVLFVSARAKLGWPRAAYAALALLPVMLLFGISWPWQAAHPFAGYGYAAWPGAFLALYRALYRVESDLAPRLAQASHCVALWLLAALAGWECAWQIDALVGEGRIWSEIGRPLAPALLAAWIATRGEASRWPFEAHLRVYVVYALAPVVAMLWLWTLHINFASSGDPAPLPYLPLLNPLDLAVALIAVLFFAWRRALESHQIPPALADALRSAPIWLGASAFVWANGILLRSLHHWAAVPFRLDAMLRSTLVQASFSVFWSLLALGAMVFANRQRIRGLWVCGAALLGVVVVKLFLLDLQRIGGMERIVSFLGVGVLLLVIGYLAPVPPRREGDSR